MYRLIVSDLDGTLLNAEHRLGSHTRHVLRAVQQHGAEIVLASGRHVRDIHHLAGLLGDRGCLISSNGAAVHDPTGHMTDCHPIPPECLDFLLLDPLFDRVHINLYRVDDWLVETPEPCLLRYHQESGFAYRVVDFTRLDDQPVLKVFYHSEDTAHLARLEQRILDRLGGTVTTTYSLPIVLEVMAHGVSKGVALARVADRLGLAPKDVIAFGDARNDLEMLRYAGKALLMANAAPEFKARLPELEIIGSNAEESVARYLESLLLT